ncbi:molybdate ABC transporter substrate-binding protein [Sciscionella marina]|uniref:molybdate ABC transporter substrate-binding protein n=1 Tax=Sciscionella marina TaxID=508770 RepID=UPI00036E486E|nr:molybdate ABC transporter substrate-binding protein [Sciscionella marina]
MRKPVIAMAALLGLALTACGSGGGGQNASGGKQTLTVSAAASLTEAFDKLKTDFEHAHPGVQVKLNYDGSSTLVQQITNGAKVDVFASADQKNMDKLVKAGDNQDAPKKFASNTLEIAVPKGNPKHIKSFADLARPDVHTVVCAPPVPCGAATKKVEQASGITLHPKSEEQNVKSVLAKVRSTDADAGLVYVSDVKTAGPKVSGVTFPENKAAVNSYPVAIVKGTKQEQLAKQFVDMLTAAEGKKRLTDAGFAVG